MSINLAEVYGEVLRKADADLNVLAFILTGSRGKGFGTEHSDYDCAAVVADAEVAMQREAMSRLPPGIHVTIYTVQTFEDHAAWSGPQRWDRYNWTHLRTQIDKTDGLIQRLIEEKGTVPPNEVMPFIAKSLDHYINQVYRSIKCLRDGDDVGYRLEAMDSIAPLLDAVFALHDHRLRPYYKYLRWELTEFPLASLPWSGGEFLQMLLSILSDGAHRNQQSIFKWVDQTFREKGFAGVFDAWGDDLWIANYSVAANS